MKEIWEHIYNYEGFYQISNTGKVRSLDRNVRHSSGNGIRTHKGKELSQNKTNGNGYKICSLSMNGIVKNHYIHRLVANAFLENKDKLPQVNHIDGDKSNNKVGNLEWCTSLENHKHCTDTGLRLLGEDSLVSKLSKEDVLEIYNIANKGYMSQREIGNMYGICQQNVSDIKRKIIWRSIHE